MLVFQGGQKTHPGWMSSWKHSHEVVVKHYGVGVYKVIGSGASQASPVKAVQGLLE